MHDGVNTMVDWKAEYKAKEALLRERGFQVVNPYEFYRDMFPKGSLQSEQGDGKGNVIATQIRPSGRGRTKQWIVDDSLKIGRAHV